MTLATDRHLSLDDVQHIVMSDMSWEFYEHLLGEIGSRSIRVTYDGGRIEIMSPLPKHEVWSRRIAALIQFACVELNVPMVALGSTTFRDAAKQKGLEPDECFYFAHAEAARKMADAFDPSVDPPPDLAVEVDITRRSIARDPIYAALGVPELWRFDGKRLQFFKLTGGRYEPSTTSMALPMLPLSDLDRFVDRLRTEQDVAVLRDFQQWVRTLKP